MSRSNVGNMNGLFTNQAIGKGQVICNYSGVLNGPLDEERVEDSADLNLLSYHSLQQAINQSMSLSYDFQLDRETQVDALDIGTLMRFANHAADEEMANCMDWYAEGMEYAVACILSLDEEYEKAYTVKQTVEVGGK